VKLAAAQGLTSCQTSQLSVLQGLGSLEGSRRHKKLIGSRHVPRLSTHIRNHKDVFRNRSNRSVSVCWRTHSLALGVL
jgi:hypothetical protein